MGANRLSALNFQQQMQQQELQRQQQYLQLRLQQDQEQTAQRDFRNSLDLAQYNRQSDRDQSLNTYRDQSLGQRTTHGEQSINERVAVREQRERLFQQKQQAGVLTREDIQQHQDDMQAKRREDASARLGQQNDQFNTMMDWRRQSGTSRDTRAANRLEWEKRKAQIASGDRLGAQELSLRKFKLQQELGALKSQQTNLVHEAEVHKFDEATDDTMLTPLDNITTQIQDNKDSQDDVLRQIREMSVHEGQQPTSGQPPIDEFGPGGGGNLPGGVQSSESGYYVGQVIQTPKGAVVVTGVDNPDDPTVRPM